VWVRMVSESLPGTSDSALISVFLSASRIHEGHEDNEERCQFALISVLLRGSMKATDSGTCPISGQKN